MGIASEEIFKLEYIQLAQVFAKMHGQTRVDTESLNKVLLAVFDNKLDRFDEAVLRAEKTEGIDRKSVKASKKYLFGALSKKRGMNPERLKLNQHSPRNTTKAEPKSKVRSDERKTKSLRRKRKEKLTRSNDRKTKSSRGMHE